MHIYAFGSVCRGEIDLGSDIDLLACVDASAPEIDVNKYSVYQYGRLRDLWDEGSPFAWHLYLESKLLYSSDGSDFVKVLGEPAQYSRVEEDCEKFRLLFERSYDELRLDLNSATFNLSCMFLAVRNFATCHSLSLGSPIFSRRSPLMVNPKLDIDPNAFSVMTRARLLSTRGYGENLSPREIVDTIQAVANVSQWMAALKGQRS
ncbi:putative nucleotidyltransferase [Massilia sp. UYP32]|jgi:predicted nucleotidyltransferase|uniref:Polymerase nucleotidyl transferase domain-containing protein n=1 Tax=Massilia timonae CCUG 45783 TaxID=883126 RepID=K9DQV6_9BURK|nr:nucleotidyltransferase domain-containing protein [Massilia timonae]EKU81117.1 hypothetical protein HMPREF9710_03576 [Massilia timonae CCUG 45783]